MPKEMEPLWNTSMRTEIVIKYKRTEEERAVSFEGDENRTTHVKFLKTNQGTCINLKPIVRKGQPGEQRTSTYVRDMPRRTVNWPWGETYEVAFMPWKGYNFEDAIVISSGVVREDIFHIHPYR